MIEEVRPDRAPADRGARHGDRQLGRPAGCGIVVAHIGRRRLFISIPFGLAHSLARLFEFVSTAPLTVAQVNLLRGDNVPTPDVPGLGDLGVMPRNLKGTIADLPTA